VRNRAKYKVILEFVNKKERDDFLGYWLDGGGEQEANFISEFEEKSMTLNLKKYTDEE
jgi:hypothetical protein